MSLEQTQQGLATVRDTWSTTPESIFNHQSWFGAASSAAEHKVSSHVREMAELDRKLDSAIEFYKNSYRLVVFAKQSITKIADAAQDAIDNLNKSTIGRGVQRGDDIQAIIDRALSANTQIVDTVAYAVSVTGDTIDQTDLPGQVSTIVEKVSAEFDQQHMAPLVEPTAPAGAPTTAVPDSGKPLSPNVSQGGPTVQQVSASPETGHTRSPTTATGNPISPGADHGLGSDLPTPSAPSASPSGGGYMPAPVGGGGGGGGSTSTGSGGGGSSTGTGSGTPAGGRNALSEKAAMQDAKLKAGDNAAAANENRPLTPFEQQQAFVSDVTQGLASGGQQALQQISNLPLAEAGQAAANQPTPPTPAATPPAAAGPSAPVAGTGGGFGSGGAGAAPIGGGGAAAPAPAPPPMPLAPPATPPSPGPVGGSASSNAASGSGTAPTGPGVHAASTNNSSQAAQAAPAPIPVSAARMERDAIAASAAAGAAKRQKGRGGDALTVARRIAAALNVGAADFGFFWVTGLCVDGTIVVANSYGLGYIPDGVNLPAQVQMATADESIPATERAKWSTYPMLAIQGWAQAHSQTLRAVIATDAQFANFDPGTARVILKPDDIPDTGKMDGRSRLEVIAPPAAAKLAATSDANLVELLPPAFADIEPPEDSSASLWFDICKPLMSTMPDRWVAHLELFLTYTEHAQELALHRALTAADAAAQRSAIADWVYWQHLGVLVSEALNADVAV